MQQSPDVRVQGRQVVEELRHKLGRVVHTRIRARSDEGLETKELHAAMVSINKRK